MPAQFQVFQDASKQYRWRLLADNHQVVAASSEGYRTRPDAENGIEVTRKGTATVAVFQDARGEWRWRTTHPNGRIIATSGEGYKSRADCERGWALTRSLAPKAPLVEEAVH